MTTINNIEDLVRLLDEHPQWLDAVRARVLTRELIELPQTLARFASGTNEHFTEVDQHLDRIDERFVEVDKRFDRIDERFVEVDQHFLLRSTGVERSLNALRDDIAPLKGAHVRNEAVREAGLIAEDMGLTLVQTLNPEQIRTLSQSKGTTDISESDLRSFRRADLIMEVTDSNGETCYVAVEVSFTANGRDTKRAVRNAEFLTRFTGKGSKAAVAGLRRDNRVDSIFESGEVFWYQLDRSDLEAE